MNKQYRMTCELTGLQIVGHVALWVVLIVLTFGVASLFWPFAAVELVINSISITEVEA